MLESEISINRIGCLKNVFSKFDGSTDYAYAYFSYITRVAVAKSPVAIEKYKCFSITIYCQPSKPVI